jgi:hypothetical protein
LAKPVAHEVHEVGAPAAEVKEPSAQGLQTTLLDVSES